MDVRRTAVCRDCLWLLQRPRSFNGPRVAAAWIRQEGRGFATARFEQPLPLRTSKAPQYGAPLRLEPDAHLQASRRASATTTQDLHAVHSRILELSKAVLKPEDRQLPSEQRILYVLEQLDSIHHRLIDAKTSNTLRGSQETTATSALLGSVNSHHHPVYLTKPSLLLLISEKSEEIIRHDTVFITPAILKSYVELQSALHQPSSFHDIFALYTHKPIPKLSEGSTRLDLLPANPNKISSAIDSKTANLALTCAIDRHDLPLALDIIDSTFCTTSFKRAKIFRQAMIPVSGLALAPLAAYALSQQFSAWQTTMDPTYAAGVAFAGIMTYVAAVSGIGYVAITTANDQMDRVTWAQGVPLWERWIREEERAAIDRVAGKWGFSEVEKRGEEEGEEWDALREFVGLRGMVLDQPSLMEGME